MSATSAGQFAGHKPLSIDQSVHRLHRPPQIVAEIAKQTLTPNPMVPWEKWVGDCAVIRDTIEAAFPEPFRDFNKRLEIPGGFPRPVAARNRVWETDTGKANFKLPKALCSGFSTGEDRKVLSLITLRSNDQFNTRVYGYDDRLRGIHKSRMILMINADDRVRLGIEKNGLASITTAVDDGIVRVLTGMQLIDYDLPPAVARVTSLSAIHSFRCGSTMRRARHRGRSPSLSRSPRHECLPVLLKAEEYERWLHGWIEDVIAFQFRDPPSSDDFEILHSRDRWQS